jgi:hypothetical protein
MATLNFFIRPLVGEFAARTLRAHTIRGLAYSLAHSEAVHRLKFVQTIGLMTHVKWYNHGKPLSGISPKATRLLFGMLASRVQRSILHIDLHGLQLALATLTESDVDFLSHWLNTSTRTERFNLMQPSNSLPPEIMSRLESSLASLEASLLAKDPQMPNHLRATHSLLISYPETVHLLDDTEIALIIDAAEVHTKTEIVKPGVTKAAGAGTRKKVTADDL